MTSERLQRAGSMLACSCMLALSRMVPGVARSESTSAAQQNVYPGLPDSVFSSS